MVKHGKRCKTRLQEKRSFKMGTETKLYIIKIFENYSVALRKCKYTLKLNKPAYVGMLDVSKIFMKMIMKIL